MGGGGGPIQLMFVSGLLPCLFQSKENGRTSIKGFILFCSYPN